MGGLEAMELQRAKGESVYELQQKEKQDQARRKEEQEIKDIEAMFRALEIAEREEARELAGEPPTPFEPEPRAGNSNKSTKGKRNGRGAHAEQKGKTASAENADGNDENGGQRRGR